MSIRAFTSFHAAVSVSSIRGASYAYGTSSKAGSDDK